MSTIKLSITIAEDAPKSSPFVLRGDWFEEMQNAAKIGYEAVELHIRNPKTLDSDKLIKCCMENSIKVSSLGTGLSYTMDGLSLSSSFKGTRVLAICRIKSYIDLAKKVGCLIIIGLIRGQSKENGDYVLFENYLTESLKECIEYAEKENVTLVLEAINRFESDVFNTIESTCDYICKFHTDKLKLHIDTFHMNIEEDNIRSNILSAKDLIAHVHFADNNRLYPGGGHFDFKSTLDALGEIGYSGYIAMECLPLPSPEEAAILAYKYLKNLDT